MAAYLLVRPQGQTPAANVVDPRLVGVGSRLAYGAHRRITPAEADAMPGRDVSGCLILGVLPDGCTGSDVYVEAQERCGVLMGRAATLSHFTATGLQRDPAGNPVILNSVRQILSGSGYALDHGDLSWMNDGWADAKQGSIRDSVIRDHLFYVRKGDVQHRDGIQAYGTGALVVDRVDFYNDAVPRPLGANGQPIGDSPLPLDTGDRNIGPADASSSVIFNSDYVFESGPSYIRDCRMFGGNSVAFNITSSDLSVRPNGDTWPMPQYDDEGNVVQGLVMSGNVIERPSVNGVVRVTAGDYREQVLFPTVTDWKWKPDTDVGPSTAMSVRADDGSLRYVQRREVIYG